MKKGLIWKLLFLVGLCPLIAPFIYYFLLRFVNGENWTLLDMLVLWSYLYWPAYLIGLGLSAIAAYKLKKNQNLS